MVQRTAGKQIDDKFMRGLIIALIGVVVAQGLSFVYIVGTIANQVSINKDDIKELKSMRDTLVSIETQVTFMSRSIQSVSKTITAIAYEQQRRTPIINHAEEYLNRRDRTK